MSDLPLSIAGSDLLAISPELVLSGVATALLLVGAFARTVDPGERWAPRLSLVGVIGAGWAVLAGWGIEVEAFHGMAILDPFGSAFKAIVLIGTGLAVLLSWDWAREEEIGEPEYYALLLYSATGMLLMAGGNDLLTIFLGLELLSLAMYILTGFYRGRPTSTEAALKYFVLGAFSTAFLLFGVAFVFGAAGTTSLSGVAAAAAEGGGTENPLLLVGMGLVLVGFGFKVASVPFHVWTPDAYEGAPTSVTAFMAVGVKTAAFAGFARVFLVAFAELQPSWVPVVGTLAVLSMVVGNVVALVQESMKRMLAYSAIAHAGYLLVGLVAGNELGVSAFLYYLLAYTLMNVGAFGVVAALEERGRGQTIREYTGLARRRPALAAAMAVFMLSLAGIPPLAGFVGKFYIFSAAVRADQIPLVLIAVLASLVSIYYYLRVVVVMYMEEGSGEAQLRPVPTSLALALAVSAWGLVQAGLFPSAFLSLARQAVGGLF